MAGLSVITFAFKQVEPDFKMETFSLTMKLIIPFVSVMFFMVVRYLNTKFDGVVKYSFLVNNVVIFLVACESGLERSPKELRLYEW
jgi:hypothetical protein